ncbi:MAG: hypothetical protein WBF17_20955, partial [Phycisphaerae bacterium]
GSLTALYFDKIYTRGDLTAAIATDGVYTRKGTAIGSLTAASVRDVSLNAPAGGIGKITVTDWLNTDAVADEITAAWIGKLTVKGVRGVAGSGDFEANLTLSNLGVAEGKTALGSAAIAGTLGRSGGNVTVHGNTGKVWVGAVRGLVTIDGDARSVTIGEAMELAPAAGGAVGELHVGGSAPVAANRQRFDLSDSSIYANNP